MRGVQFSDGGSYLYDDQGNPIEEAGAAQRKPLVLIGADGKTEADHIPTREDLIAIMQSQRYKEDRNFREAIAKLIENSDPVALGLEQEPATTVETVLENQRQEAKDGYIKKVFGSDQYQNDPNFRYRVMNEIVANPEMAEDLAEGHVKDVSGQSGSIQYGPVDEPEQR